MNIFDLNSFVVLIVLLKNDKSRDSYTLNKVLGWKFDIFPVPDLLEKMQSENLIIKRPSNPLNLYESTDLGRDYVKVNFEEGKRMAFDKFSKEREYLNLLFNGFTL